MQAHAKIPAVLAAALYLALLAPNASAYVGPGAGLSVLGALFALLAAVVLAIVGFVWYPVKRLLARRTRDGMDRDGMDLSGGPTRGGE